MNRQSVTSSHIKSIGHEPITNTLEVEFLNGSVYKYSDVQEKTFEDLIAHPSKGAALKSIARLHKFERVS